MSMLYRKFNENIVVSCLETQCTDVKGFNWCFDYILKHEQSKNGKIYIKQLAKDGWEDVINVKLADKLDLP